MDKFYAYHDVEDGKPVHIDIDKGVIQQFHNCTEAISSILGERYNGKPIRKLKGDFDFVIPQRIEVTLQIIESFHGKIKNLNNRIAFNTNIKVGVHFLEQERNKAIVKLSEYEQRVLFEAKRMSKTHGFHYKPKY